MDKQNVTLSLPKALIKKAKLIAKKKDKSFSQFLRETLEETVMSDENFKRAYIRQIRYLKIGFELGTEGQIRNKREELHARR